MTEKPERAAPSQEWPKLAIDANEYLHFLDECDWTEDQKREFIDALWGIVVGFVDMGFGIHPLQQASAELTLEADSPSVVGSIYISNEFNDDGAAIEIDRARQDS